ncbi:MAG TPA: hypothetical protein VIH61_09430 [Waddliaceae bacterium]
MIILYGQVKNGVIIPNNSKEVIELEGKEVSVKLERKTHVRTNTQSRALHLWLEQVAQELNASGQTVQLVLKQTVDINWTGILFKELVWRPIQKALLKKDSTTKLEKVMDIDIVYDHINLYLGEKFHIHVPWPKREEITPLQVKDYPINGFNPSF